MSTDTMSNRSVLRSDRRTVTQLLAAAEKDTDTVSVFMAGCTVADTEAAVFVVKGPKAIAYLRELCKRQGLLTPGKPLTDPKTPNGRSQAGTTGARPDRSEQAAGPVGPRLD